MPVPASCPDACAFARAVRARDAGKRRFDTEYVGKHMIPSTCHPAIQTHPTGPACDPCGLVLPGHAQPRRHRETSRLPPGRRKICAGYAGDFEKTPFILREAAYLIIDHVQQIGRSAILRNRRFRWQAPCTVSFDDHSLIDGELDDDAMNNGCPRSLEHGFRRCGHHCVVAEPQCEMSLDLHSRRSIEAQLAAALVYLQILMQAPNRMLADGAICRPIGTEDQHRGLAISSRKAGEGVQRCQVAPMQILETITHGRSALSASTRSQNSRSMRSRVAPNTSR